MITIGSPEGGFPLWEFLSPRMFSKRQINVHAEMHARNFAVGLQSLDEVDLKEVFMMKPIMRSCLKNVIRLACKTIVQGRMVNNVELETQGGNCSSCFSACCCSDHQEEGWSPARG